MSEPSREDPVYRCLALLKELGEELTLIQIPHPAYPPDKSPTAYQSLSEILKLIRFSIRQVEVFLGSTPEARAQTRRQAARHGR